MAESYKSLESRTSELEAELNSLLTKMESLTSELLEERQSHQEDLAKYKDLQEQMERIEKNSMSVDGDIDIKSKQRGAESPRNGCSVQKSPSDTESSPFSNSPISSKRQKHRSSRSPSAAAVSNPLPEKHGRGFSRFFSKGKSEH
ncbi:Filament-like plant protein 4 [Ananas comosus]|uniref:Filament-like plant protein 4 n=1 Tax=Ananas comosus TaxID=4615 RepID=A0A199V5N2_ANACO|nr:Filament-like plant protein 4 [Ananas comosus]